MLCHSSPPRPCSPKTKGPITTKFVGIRKIHNPEKNLGLDPMGRRRTLICSALQGGGLCPWPLNIVYDSQVKIAR